MTWVQSSTRWLSAFLATATVVVLALPVEGAESEPAAVEIAESVMAKMGGLDAWNQTSYLRWRFFGARTHYWDRGTGNVRIESEDRLVLMNVNTRDGRVWHQGEEIVHPDSLAEALTLGHKWWVNDSYWLIMPMKLLDPGVNLTYAGERPMEDGRDAHVLGMTFDAGVGYTPQNRYEVFVAKDTGLVEQWSFFAKAEDEDPRFTLPWTGWQQFGGILIATGHGRDMDWEVAAPQELPESVFESPDPVEH